MNSRAAWKPSYMAVSSGLFSMPASSSASRKVRSTDLTPPEPEPPPSQSVEAQPKTLTLVTDSGMGRVSSVGRTEAEASGEAPTEVEEEPVVAPTEGMPTVAAPPVVALMASGVGPDFAAAAPAVSVSPVIAAPASAAAVLARLTTLTGSLRSSTAPVASTRSASCSLSLVVASRWASVTSTDDGLTMRLSMEE